MKGNRRLWLLLVLVVISVILLGCSKQQSTEAPSGPATEAPQVQPKIAFRTEPDPPKGAADNTLRVSVTDQNGKPLSDSQVRVTLVMPAMPEMKMQEIRESAELSWSGSEYVGKARIPTPGTWNVTVEVFRSGRNLGTQKTTITAQ